MNNTIIISQEVNSEKGVSRAYMLICLYEQASEIFYCIRTAEIAEQKSNKNYQEIKNAKKHVTFKIIKHIFVLNREFEFEI